VSQPPLPPPYGLPPGQPPPEQPSNKGRFWLGVVLAIPAIILGPVLIGAAASLGDAVASGSALPGLLGGLVALLLLVGFIALVVIDRTRWIGLGMLAGFAGLFILGAGACVALIVAYSNSV
jgi:hypothetical protein